MAGTSAAKGDSARSTGNGRPGDPTDAADDDTVRPDAGRTLASRRAATMVVDVAPGQAAPDTPDEVTPQRVRPQPAPVTRTKPTRRLRPGDLVCAICGEGNPPRRRYCSRCGDELTSADVVKPPWWHRLRFWHRWRRRRVHAAGQRPGEPGTGKNRRRKLMAVYRKVRLTIAVVFTVIGLLYIFLAPVRGMVNDAVGDPVASVKERVRKTLNPRYVPVRAPERSATAQLPDHGPELAVDQFNNTYWAAPWDQQQFPRLVLVFDRPVTIERIILTSGAGDDFAANHRPSVLHLVYSNNESDDLRPQDGATPQTFSLTKAKDITTIEIGITDVYRAQEAQSVAIAELELFAKE